MTSYRYFASDKKLGGWDLMSIRRNLLFNTILSFFKVIVFTTYFHQRVY